MTGRDAVNAIDRLMQDCPGVSRMRLLRATRVSYGMYHRWKENPSWELRDDTVFRLVRAIAMYRGLYERQQQAWKDIDQETWTKGLSASARAASSRLSPSRRLPKF